MQCWKCGQDKPEQAFSSRKGWCLDCLRAYNLEAYHRRKHTVKYQKYRRAYSKQYHLDHADEVNERSRRWAKAHPNYGIETYARVGRGKQNHYSDVEIIWRSKHQDSLKASQLVFKAVKAGLLERPKECIMCGRESLTYGHHKDYDSPYDVIWLCGSCHKKIHLGLIKI